MKTRRSFFRQCLGAIAAGLGVGGAIKSMPKGFAGAHERATAATIRDQAAYPHGYYGVALHDAKKGETVRVAIRTSPLSPMEAVRADCDG